ncbi:MAG: hypothetical protein NTV68_11500 [Methanomicrobiales archaeon]|nr:hypothetical protein [Methanomicrobiales archaeon]
MGRFPWAVDMITFNGKGIIDLADPASFKSVIVEDMSNQNYLQRLYRDKVPVMGDVFQYVEKGSMRLISHRRFLQGWKIYRGNKPHVQARTAF